jgi:hypothetical protein
MRDLLIADEARAIVKAIDNGKPDIARTTYIPVFRSLQAYAIEQVILAVTRLYERQGRQYPLRSLPAVVDIFESHAATLTLAEPSMLRTPLQMLRLWTPGLDHMTEPERVKTLAAMLRTCMPTPATDPALDSLKTIRDKALAHRENVPAASIPRTTWEPIDEMIRHAKCTVAVIAGGYLSIGYMMDDGRVGLSDDAGMAGYSVERLIAHLVATDRVRTAP